jgi:hypothetical protein
LESKLKAELAVDGSLEYVLTWKHWGIGSPPQICALRARGRHIGDSGYFGPVGWATPTATDSSGRTHAYAGGDPTKIALHLRGQITGPSLNWSAGQMVAPAALDPEFVRWLMGFPVKWSSCVPMETQSFRSLLHDSSERT